ncbi:4'-phosphopantetheinyl transferase family protein [Pontimicrobium sp. MEBiC01747]
MKHSVSIIKMDRVNKAYNASVSLVKKEFIKIPDALHLFHNSERKYYENLKYDRRKLNYILGRFSAKLAVNTLSKKATLESIKIGSGVFGFPIVKCLKVKNIQVSITHCGNIGMSVAFKESHPMGIDIEEINCDKEKAILSQITHKEIELLKTLEINNISGFTALWCAKEALAKIIKTGMMLDFVFLEIENIKKEGTTFVATFQHFGQYKAMCHVNKNYAIAIVLPRKTSTDLTKVWTMFDTNVIEPINEKGG